MGFLRIAKDCKLVRDLECSRGDESKMSVRLEKFFPSRMRRLVR